jgi:CheY-like chemotaxis protein
MVVDDDDLVHLISKKILSAYACISHVYSAYNGKEAIVLLHRSCEGAIKIPAVVLLDLHMPVMNGFQFMEEVKQMDCLKGSKVVTVMFSSTIDPREIEQRNHWVLSTFFKNR